MTGFCRQIGLTNIPLVITVPATKEFPSTKDMQGELFTQILRTLVLTISSEECLQTLSFPEIEAGRHNIDTALETTCTWLFEHPLMGKTALQAALHQWNPNTLMTALSIWTNSSYRLKVTRKTCLPITQRHPSIEPRSRSNHSSRPLIRAHSTPPPLRRSSAAPPDSKLQIGPRHRLRPVRTAVALRTEPLRGQRTLLRAQELDT